MEKKEYDKMYQQENNFWWYKVLHQIVEFSIIKYANSNHQKIFDAGCGTGRMLELLQNYGETSGMDFSKEAVVYSKERGLERIYQGDINSWEYKENYYDFIISLDVVCHESIIDETDIYRKMKKGLKKDGYLVLNLPAFNHLRRDHDICVQTKKRFVRSELVNRLKGLNFTIVKATYRMPILYFIIVLQKLVRTVFKPKSVDSDVKAVSKWINNLFYFLGRIENKYLLKVGNIPFGSSLFVIAQKIEKNE